MTKTPLQKLLSLRRISATQIAKDTGLGYHAVQKTIKNQRHSSRIRQAIALYLNLDYDHLWGDQSGDNIKELIRHEIDRKTATTAHHLVQKFLD
nr:hypothetical protein [uncultured Desulfuromonas sp.]